MRRNIPAAGHDKSQALDRQAPRPAAPLSEEQQCFRQELPYNPKTGGAKRRPHRQFVLPRGAPSQQQNGNIAETYRQEQSTAPNSNNLL